MYAGADASYPSVPKPLSKAAREVEEILKLRQDLIDSRELLYCSPVVRLLIEEEIPRLVSLIGRDR